MPERPDQQSRVPDALAGAAASPLAPSGGDRAGLELDLRARLARNPHELASLEQLSGLLAQQGRFGEATELLQRAVELAPGEQNICVTLSRMLLQRGHTEEALDELKRLRPPFRFSFEVRTTEAGLLGILGRYAEQIDIYKKLLRRYPTDPRLWERLGNALKYSGRTTEAVRAFQRSVKLNPAYGEGWWALANFKTFRFDPGDVAAMRTAFNGSLGAVDAKYMSFALGKALEDRGEYEESFRYYAEGNRFRAAEFGPEQMNVGRVAQYVDEGIAAFDTPLFDRIRHSGYPARDPIFVFGLQRSGSTLIEQILASHPLIEGIAEPDSMQHVWVELESAAVRSGRTVRDEIRGLDEQRLHEIGADYLERSRPYRKTDRPFFVDKRPANWMYVGLIRLALPNATIVDARRHPMACGFSNFKQHYSGGMPYAYSLETIGRYYAEYLRLMAHFDEVQAGSVHHLLNEALIADPETEIRRLLDFVGVPFDPACLDFHKNKRAVHTPSAEQVRRPINRDGLDQWRHYEPWLDPLKKALGPALESWATISS